MFLKITNSTEDCFLKIVLLFLIVLTFNSLQAQEIHAVSLNEALKLAKENNKKILRSQLETTLSEQNIKERKELRLPDIELNGEYSRITNITEFKGNGFLNGKEVTKAIPEIYQVNSSFKMPIYAGNKINNAIKIANQESEIAKIKTEKTENDIELEVVANYLAIYKMMELQKIFEENIKEEKSRLKEVQSLQKHGTITKNEVIRAELQLSDRELNSLTNSKNIKIALHDLKTLIQLPETEEITIDTTANMDELNGLDPYDFYLEKAFQNEEMRIASQELNIKKTELKLVKGNYLPTVNFFGNYGFYYPNYKFFPPNPYLYTLGQIGIEAHFDISALYKNKTKVQQASTEIEWQKMQSEIIKDEIQDKLFKEHTQYQEILEKFVVVDKALDLANENYRIVKLKYLNQLVLITEMVDADNALLQAKYNKISTRLDAILKHYELLHTAGIMPQS
ncbi:Outer membrane protein TolC [Flavobacterium pectinovorum]|uniref:Outer membrane protein TolC n=1 Tax=Flavobacterium pectinovorum TaxID=29533 RepID=A0AB36P2T8_9FLAO|nr:TolC family protein [Flavobacterium pectinovorum]OXB05741.1 transporter [Flavobacterium pectinovorum]SHM09235.1 Outer membrane protein TolC [Flavobacterium pectinovorum]